MPLSSLPRKKQRTPISHEQESGARVYQERFLDRLGPTKGVILTKTQRASAWEKMYEEARNHLERLDANAACSFLEGVGITVLECYLVAEQDGQNREAILRQFPKPGQSARLKFHASAEVETKVAEAEAVVSAQAPAPAPKPKARAKPRTKKQPSAVGAQAAGEGN